MNDVWKVSRRLCKHLNARHAHSIPEGFTILPDELDEYTEDCWRLWHERNLRFWICRGTASTL